MSEKKKCKSCCCGNKPRGSEGATADVDKALADMFSAVVERDMSDYDKLLWKIAADMVEKNERD